MANIVQRLDNDVIFVKKVGDQTADSMAELYKQVSSLAKQLRSQDKPVLILADASDEGKMDLKARQKATEIGKQLDFDRSATYGAEVALKATRDLMIRATELQAKVRNFDSRAEAEKWLLS